MPRPVPWAATWFLKPWSTRAFSTVPPGVHGDLVEQGDARGVVVCAGGQDGDGDDQAQHVNGQAPLAARHPFRRVQAGRGGGDPSGRVDTLGVQHHQGRVL